MTTQDKLDIRTFGAALIQTRDLDPVYCALYDAGLEPEQKARWLRAYMMFDHVGSASWLSEFRGEAFWAQCSIAARNEDLSPLGGRWPRSAERRHFRGAKCVAAVNEMQDRDSHPESWVYSLVDCRTEKEVIKAVKTWPLFGPWAAFKLADLLETTMGFPIKFDPNIGLLYDEPAAALKILETQHTKMSAQDHYTGLMIWITQYQAPPAFRRSCGPQELETVLCKWKSYLGGHYYIGKDIHEQRAALKGWGRTADKMLAAYPEEVK